MFPLIYHAWWRQYLCFCTSIFVTFRYIVFFCFFGYGNSSWIHRFEILLNQWSTSVHLFWVDYVCVCLLVLSILNLMETQWQWLCLFQECSYLICISVLIYKLFIMLPFESSLCSGNRLFFSWPFRPLLQAGWWNGFRLSWDITLTLVFIS